MINRCWPVGGIGVFATSKAMAVKALAPEKQLASFIF